MSEEEMPIGPAGACATCYSDPCVCAPISREDADKWHPCQHTGCHYFVLKPLTHCDKHRVGGPDLRTRAEQVTWTITVRTPVQYVSTSEEFTPAKIRDTWSGCSPDDTLVLALLDTCERQATALTAAEQRAQALREQLAEAERLAIDQAISHWFTQGGDSQFGPIANPDNADELISRILSRVREAERRAFEAGWESCRETPAWNRKGGVADAYDGYREDRARQQQAMPPSAQR